jgi:hypothetical protein
MILPLVTSCSEQTPDVITSSNNEDNTVDLRLIRRRPLIPDHTGHRIGAKSGQTNSGPRNPECQLLQLAALLQTSNVVIGGWLQRGVQTVERIFLSGGVGLKYEGREGNSHLTGNPPYSILTYWPEFGGTAGEITVAASREPAHRYARSRRIDGSSRAVQLSVLSHCSAGAERLRPAKLRRCDPAGRALR